LIVVGAFFCLVAVLFLFAAALPSLVAVVRGTGLPNGLLVVMNIESGSGPTGWDGMDGCDPWKIKMVTYISGFIKQENL
jgi:hypothetical protein